MRRLLGYAVLVVAVVALTPLAGRGFAAPKTPDKNAKVDFNDLNLHLNALKTLASLELDAAQQKALMKLAEGAGDKKRARDAVKGSDTLYKAMTDLRAALVKGDEI